jgi:ATP-dependent DNA helicase RecQ
MKKSKKAVRTVSAKTTRKSDILNARGLDLFEELRALRTRLAREAGIPPYMIFSDKTRVDMCVKTPLTEEAMFTVNGVGQNKFDRYGTPFMEAIRAFTGGVNEKLYFGEAQELQQEMPRPRKERTKKEDFYLTREQADAFPYAEKYLTTELAEKLSSLRDVGTVKKISGAELFRVMEDKKLASEGFENGHYKKTVSPAGQEAGLFIGMRMSKKGTEYEDVYYSEKAQRMIVERYVRAE